MKALIPWIALILILSPVALVVQNRFVYSDSPFLSNNLGSVQAQEILKGVFNLSVTDKIFVIVNGSYPQALSQVNSSLKYLRDARLVTPYDYLNQTLKAYNETISPLVNEVYKRLLPAHELYLNLTERRNADISNLTAFLYVLNVTYGVPLNRTVEPSPSYFAFLKVYENLSKVQPPLQAARNASLIVFKDPLVLLFSFNNYTDVDLVASAIKDNSSLAYLAGVLTGKRLPLSALENPYAYAYHNVSSRIPPPPISLSDFHKGDSWLFIVEVPSNESLSDVLQFINSVNGTVTGHLPIYAESMEETDRNLRLVDLATVAILGVLLIVLLRSIYPILVLLLSAVLGLEIAYGAMLLLDYLGLYKIYYISGLVVPPIVFGITVDYSTLFLYRYYEELGKGAKDPLKSAYRNVRVAILVSGLTIAVGFVSFLLTPSALLSNIGIALLISAISSLLPPLTFMRTALGSVSIRALKFPRKELPKATDVRQAYLRRVSNWAVKTKGLVIVAYLAITFLSYFHVVHSPTNVAISEIISADSAVYKGLNVLQDYFKYSVDYLIIRGNPNESYSQIYNLSKSLINQGALVYGPASYGNITFENRTYLTNLYYKDNYTLVIVYLPYPVFSDGAINMTSYLMRFGVVAGENAERVDVVNSATRDYYAITLPLTIALILGYLMVSLRSVFMSVRLVLTLLASSVIGLSITFLIFNDLYWLTPLVIFAILFSLGIDYDMFIIVRSLEERGSPSERLLKAVEVTGLAVTSAGLVLAGAFFSLYVSGMRFLQEIGVGVALTILMDTFLVRTIIVPAVVSLAERFAWWPRKLEDNQ
ncbi:MAG: MMPL family transporter [Thermoprotei archaeon]